MIYNRFKSYDYAEKVALHTTLPVGSSSGELNKLFFDSNDDSIGINVDSTQAGLIEDTFTEVSAGDVIEVSFDMKVINGVKPRVFFREFNSSGSPFDIHSYQVTATNSEWRKYNYKYSFRNLNNSRKVMIRVGSLTADVAQFKIKNLRVNIKTKRKYEPIQPTQYTFKPFELKKEPSIGFIIRGDYSGGEGVLSLQDPNTLRITFTKPFIKRPVATTSTDWFQSSYKYTPKVGGITTGYADIRFYDGSNTLVTIASIEDNCHFGLLFTGLS